MQESTSFSMYPLLLFSGVATHLLYFIRGEHHLHPLRPLGSYVLLLLCLWIADFIASENGLAEILCWALRAVSTHLTGLSMSIVIYRAYFHRLRHFPGPPLARISKGWLLWQNVKSQQAYLELEKLHGRYGKFVRIGTIQIHGIRATLMPDRSERNGHLRCRNLACH